ncbi:lysine--tRNA ligase [Patescibacteria group bacterium]|nr:MAG: lysine--tRNA ligase [Patescibacteria group bacterium]
MADEIVARLEKLNALRAEGVDPYPPGAARSATVEETLAHFAAWLDEARGITLAGRIMTIRVHGGLLFADLRDGTGRMQIALKEDADGAGFARMRDRIDPADIVEATGTLFTTKRGEQTLLVRSWRPLAKALLPLPEKWHGLTDVETRFRERELDLIANTEVRERFVLRSRALHAMRAFLQGRGFMEVETPMLHPIAGGASARPFVTRHNALGVELYLRVAPELYLKRLLVGGFEKIFEIGRCFRNEGIDYSHNPEFTMLELYWAYARKEEFLSFLEELLGRVLQETTGGTSVTYEGETLDFAAPWPRTTFREIVLEACGLDIDALRTPQALAKAAKGKKLDIDFSDCVGLGACYDELYKRVARPQLIRPTWVLDYPIEMKPLTRVHPEDPTKSASAQLVVRGAEVINAFYHELNDPEDQRRRFEEQQALREQGSAEAQPMDEAFLRALGHGMPPAAGVGVGVDRLIMLLTGAHNIKETILFPTLRPEHPV